ncbi:MAG TPA: acyltransferase [Ramlibacter sp.]|nr:acyltransferase [Ramlibacter sp.]HSV55380.1 acyltransferase [Burkholderiaceae bacterium]
MTPHSNERTPEGSQRLAHLDGLDGLRGLAIILVLIHHLTVMDPAGTWEIFDALTEFSSYGVDLFFVLSGFLIVGGLQREAGAPGWARRFWVKRAAKIAPLYFAGVALVFLVLPALLSMAGAGAKAATQLTVRGNWPWYTSFGSNILNAIDGRFTNPALDVCWSLALEMQFYLLVAVWVALRGVPGRRTLGVVLALAMATRVLAALAGANWISILVLPWHRLDAFALGAAVALGYWRWICGYPGRAVCAVVFAMPFFLPWSREHFWVAALGYTAVALAGAHLVHLASASRPGSFTQAFFVSRFLRWCGSISYSVYLTHLPLRAVLRDVFLPYAIRPIAGGSAAAEQAIFYAVAGATCLLAGWVVWRYFEEPVRQRILSRVLPAVRLSEVAARAG